MERSMMRGEVHLALIFLAKLAVFYHHGKIALRYKRAVDVW